MVFDAQVELGRYQAAVVTAQAMVGRVPTQGSLARVSYARELLGDPAGAVAAMVQAAAAGGGSPTDQAYVQTLIGNLHLGAAFRRRPRPPTGGALDGDRGYGLAEVGPARVAAARGDLAGAARLLEPAAERLPLPATVALLGDVRVSLGDDGPAATQYELVRVIERLNRANGVAVDLELVRFEADHARDRGADPRRAVAMAWWARPSGPPSTPPTPSAGRCARPAGPARPCPTPGPRSASAPATPCSGTTWPRSRPTSAGRRRPAATWPRPSRSTPTCPATGPPRWPWPGGSACPPCHRTSGR